MRSEQAHAMQRPPPTAVTPTWDANTVAVKIQRQSSVSDGAFRNIPKKNTLKDAARLPCSRPLSVESSYAIVPMCTRYATYTTPHATPTWTMGPHCAKKTTTNARQTWELTHVEACSQRKATLRRRAQEHAPTPAASHLAQHNHTLPKVVTVCSFIGQEQTATSGKREPAYSWHAES